MQRSGAMQVIGARGQVRRHAEAHGPRLAPGVRYTVQVTARGHPPEQAWFEVVDATRGQAIRQDHGQGADGAFLVRRAHAHAERQNLLAGHGRPAEPAVEQLSIAIGAHCFEVLEHSHELRVRDVALRGEVLGRPPYGYRVLARRLRVEPAEADVVRGIFHRYLDLGEGNSLVVAGRSVYKSKNQEIEPGVAQVRAVIGGTGLYIGAAGQVTTTRNADGSYDHVVELVN